MRERGRRVESSEENEEKIPIHQINQEIRVSTLNIITPGDLQCMAEVFRATNRKEEAEAVDKLLKENKNPEAAYTIRPLEEGGQGMVEIDLNLPERHLPQKKNKH